MLFRGFLGLSVFIVLIMAGLYARYGGGAFYPRQTGAAFLGENNLETVLAFDQPIGNVAVAEDGRVFFTVHPESRPTGAKLWCWHNGQARPWPADQSAFVTPLGVRIHGGKLWLIDHGNHGLNGARLFAFDLQTEKRAFEYRFDANSAPLGSFLQDMAVSDDVVYIADVSFARKSPAIVVLDLKTKTSRRVLERHPSVMPQDWIIRTYLKPMTFFGGLLALKPGIDGIALSSDGKTLFYGAMAHDTLFKLNLPDLTTPVAVGKKPLSDGLSTDAAGNVYITDVEYGAVVRMNPEGKKATLVQSEKIRWADALSFGPNGYLYLADSALPDQMLQSKAHIQQAAPYFIYRFQTGFKAGAGQ